MKRLSKEDSPDHESGQIIEVIQQGYLLGERVIRPAPGAGGKIGRNKWKDHRHRFRNNQLSGGSHAGGEPVVIRTAEGERLLLQSCMS